jgi:non-heme chloroperoxidase
MIDRRHFIGSAAAAATVLALPPAFGAGRERRVRTSDAAKLYVRDSGGKGRPVILTHAWPLSGEIWEAQAAALAQASYRVIAYDRRGFGRSDQPGRGYDFDTFADDLARVIDDLQLRDAALIGYSMGGGEVVRYFSRHRGRGVAKAGFVGAAASYLLKTPDNPDGIDAAVFDGMKAGVRGDRRNYLRGVLKDVFFDVSKPSTISVTPESLERWLDVAMQADPVATERCIDAFNATDFRPELAAVTVPSLVLHGTADIPVPLALARGTARGIAGSKLIEYAGVSHGLVVTEAERVTRDLLSFIG